MCGKPLSVVRAALTALIVLAPGPRSLGAPPRQSPAPARPQKLPHPVPLGRGVVFERDPSSGELRSPPPDAGSGAASGVIHSRVTLVEVACTVTAPDGTQVRGLTQQNFRVFDDGTLQEIASFDATSAPASIVLVVDASPSIYRELAEMRDAARSLAQNLSPADEVGVVSFSEEAHLLLPFSTNRALLDRALESKYLARVEDSSQSNIYQAVFLTARELFRGRAGRKAIVLLTDGQDSGLGLAWDPASAQPRAGAGASRLSFDDVSRELGADGVALFIVSTENRPRAMTAEWLEAHRGEMLVTEEARRLQMPHYTLYLAELARRASGQLYFLREIGNLSEIYRRIAMTISAQYTLGYYPSGGRTGPGWHSLRVELASQANVPPGSRIAHRVSYYVSALP